MDREGFRALLLTRNLDEAGIEDSIALAERFEAFLDAHPDLSPARAVAAFSRLLIDEGQNTEANYLALARYGIFVKSNEIYVAVLELLDGAEAQGNLYRLVGERFGKGIRDEVFAGIGLSPLGAPSPDKPHHVHPVLARLAERVGAEARRELLSGCLRDLPDEYFLDDRQKYVEARDIDDYLEKQHQTFIEQLEACQREGKLFFAQPVTDEVISLVRNDPEIGSGRREGAVLYVSKIPYQAVQFLAETDPVLKRYYACHCPWAREAIRHGDVQLEEALCACSGGFHKRSWEVIFERSLRVDVLESVLGGDMRCRFAIHLPEEALPA